MENDIESVWPIVFDDLNLENYCYIAPLGLVGRCKHDREVVNMTWHISIMDMVDRYFSAETGEMGEIGIFQRRQLRQAEIRPL